MEKVVCSRSRNGSRTASRARLALWDRGTLPPEFDLAADGWADGWDVATTYRRTCYATTPWGRDAQDVEQFDRQLRASGAQRPPLAGWSAVTCIVALAFTATIIVALATQQAGRPDLLVFSALAS